MQFLCGRDVCRGGKDARYLDPSSRDRARSGREAGFTCGVEPRILKGRDPDWTCIVDGKRIAGDIYIHQADTTLSAGMAALVFGLLGVLLLVALSEAWVIIRLRRGPSGSRSAGA